MSLLNFDTVLDKDMATRTLLGARTLMQAKTTVPSCGAAFHILGATSDKLRKMITMFTSPIKIEISEGYMLI